MRRFSRGLAVATLDVLGTIDTPVVLLAPLPRPYVSSFCLPEAQECPAALTL